jgi:hypothetical protein
MNLCDSGELLNELIHRRLALPDGGTEDSTLLKVLDKHVQRVRSQRHMPIVVRMLVAVRTKG